MSLILGSRDSKRTVETLLVCDVVNKQDTHGASVVSGCDSAEALLSCSVPYLQLHTLAVKFDRADLEVDSDGGDKGRSEGVFAEAQQTARFADAGVAYEEQLDLQIAQPVSMGWKCMVLSACSFSHRRTGVPSNERKAHRKVDIQGNHSSSFPPSQRMCAERFQVGVEVVRPRVVFPGRPLRVGGAAVFRKERDPLAQFPEACSLVLDRNSLYCVVAVWRATWINVPGRRLTGDKERGASAEDIPFASETWRRVVCRREMVPRGGAADCGCWVVGVVVGGWQR